MRVLIGLFLLFLFIGCTANGAISCDEVPDDCELYFDPVCDNTNVTQDNDCTACAKGAKWFVRGEC